MLTCTTLPVLNEQTKNGHALRGVGRDAYGAPACAGQGGNCTRGREHAVGGRGDN